MQAIKASAAIAILTVPRDHGFLQSPELAACLHDSAFHMCPSPRRGEVMLASTRLPTWPCPDSELLALEALGRISKLPLRLGNLTELSYASLLKTSGPFVAHRPPICDGAGAPSSADHSLPHDSGISKASNAWLQWAQKSNLSAKSLRPHQPKPTGASPITRRAVRGASDPLLRPEPGPGRHGDCQSRPAFQTRAHASTSPAYRRPRLRPPMHTSRRSSHGRFLRNKTFWPLAAGQAPASVTVRPRDLPRQLAPSRGRSRDSSSPPSRRRSRGLDTTGARRHKSSQEALA